MLPDDEKDLFSPGRSLLYFFSALLLSERSEPDAELPFEEDDLFGLSPAFGALFDDLPDWSPFPLPGLLNAIVFELALSQRVGVKVSDFLETIAIFFIGSNIMFSAFKRSF